ncbi:MAG TPA: YicC/YloC family endoribonuclease [Rectinemataceae bacterium]|nr:YicC/YloC family endoribonuclease [Rectinemataceae bacterium]
MIRSMTGFGHKEFSTGLLQGSLEIKSWNNRYLDISVSGPAWLSVLEPKIRDYVAGRVTHGKIEIGLRARSLDVPVRASVDAEAARAVSQALRELAQAAGISEGPRLSDIVAVEGILGFERELDAEAAWREISTVLDSVFRSFDASRIAEGAELERDILASLSRIESGRESIAAQAPSLEESLRKQVRERFAELLGSAIDESRVLAEVASLLMKYTINEEIVRLGAHLVSFRRILAEQATPAKKLDFLCQEMNREVNTIGSKSTLLSVSESVVELKDALENIREQLRNIE